MGLMLTFMFLWNMLGALLLLPALAHYLVKPSAEVDVPQTQEARL
jgi:predicted RND superfamily exporter protein